MLQSKTTAAPQRHSRPAPSCMPLAFTRARLQPGRPTNLGGATAQVLMTTNAPCRNATQSTPEHIKQVILAGHKSQQIEGIPDSVPVIVQTAKASSCPSCIRKAGYFYSYDEHAAEHGKAVNALETLTGLKLTSFQGAYSENSFHVFGGRGGVGAIEAKPVYVGHVFRDELTLAGMSVMLPEGEWLGIVHQKNDSVSGEDEMLVLAQVTGGQMQALYAVRARTNHQRQGFPTHRACDLIRGYVVTVDVNEPFGPQTCKWVTHVTQPWTQPTFAAAADRLNAMSVDAPPVVIATGLHQAGMGQSVSVIYYDNPQFQGIATPNASWSQSEWHVSRLSASPTNQAYVNDQLRQAQVWHQIWRSLGRQ